jgi:hypothetical protein
VDPKIHYLDREMANILPIAVLSVVDPVDVRFPIRLFQIVPDPVFSSNNFTNHYQQHKYFVQICKKKIWPCG